MLEMHLTYALVDLHPLLPAAQVTSPPLSSLARQQRREGMDSKRHFNSA
jgi:hypothetical protein